jgi:hypothetical protein
MSLPTTDHSGYKVELPGSDGPLPLVLEDVSNPDGRKG